MADKTVSVRATDLKPGDMFVKDNVMVTAVYDDPEGIWIETDNGDVGYAPDWNSRYLIWAS